MARFVLNFKRQFAAAVETGAKRQTIRATRKDNKRPQVGDVACCYTGLRTASTRHLVDAPVVRCRALRIDYEGNGSLVIDGDLIAGQDREAFAKADGFATWWDMLTFFKDQHMQATFEGWCVEWSTP
jgi:hypothetical protein